MSARVHPSATGEHTRLLPRVLAAGAVALLAVLGTAGPAAAHDRLVSSDPAADETVTVLPPELTLTFSANLLADAGATIVEVTTPDGTHLEQGSPVVNGANVTQGLAGEVEATTTVTVTWKTVSGDGHPISDVFSFVVEGSAPTATPTTTPISTAEPTSPTSPTPTATALPGPPMEASPGIPPWIWAVIGLLGAGVAGALVYLLVARTRGGAGDGGDTL